jgi:hypothetical protein
MLAFPAFRLHFKSNMEMQNQNETVPQLFNKIQGQLQAILQTADQAVATKNIVSAETLMNKMEALLLSNPYVTDEDVSRVVSFSRGTLWNQARQHVSSLVAA